MKIRTRAWIIVILVGWTYPAWWIAIQITIWVSDSVNTVENMLKDRAAARVKKELVNRMRAAGLDP